MRIIPRKIKVRNNVWKCYSIKDIEKFFNGNWCTRLLEMIDCQLTGKDILGKIKAQCA